MPQKTEDPNAPQIGIDDLPEIALLNREIERFKKTMLQNPSQEEENSYRAVAERHLLSGLERARDLLILSYLETRPRPQ
jgi:hypothetical protein